MMPIPCVDLLVFSDNCVLLVKRANEPARGQWWFPGGRVHHLEAREKAVARKLREECGIGHTSMHEAGTYDVFLSKTEASSSSTRCSHAITTLYYVEAESNQSVVLDAQSQTSKWLPCEAWLRQPLNAFVQEHIRRFHTRRRSFPCGRI
jgi:colanic acid biosynthesis protein WcaH